jgi:hypothetical protein
MTATDALVLGITLLGVAGILVGARIPTTRRTSW